MMWSWTMNFKSEQFKLIYSSACQYHNEKIMPGDEILDKLFNSVYTQSREQPT